MFNFVVDEKSEAIDILNRLSRVPSQKLMKRIQYRVVYGMTPQGTPIGGNDSLVDQWQKKWKSDLKKLDAPRNVYEVIKKVVMGNLRRGFFTESSLRNIKGIINGNSMSAGFTGNWGDQGKKGEAPFGKVLRELDKLFASNKVTNLYPANTQIHFDSNGKRIRHARVGAFVKRDRWSMKVKSLIHSKKINLNAPVTASAQGIKWPDFAKKYFGLRDFPLSPEPFDSKRWNKGRWGADDFFTITPGMEADVMGFIWNDINSVLTGEKNLQDDISGSSMAAISKVAKIEEGFEDKDSGEKQGRDVDDVTWDIDAEERATLAEESSESFWQHARIIKSGKLSKDEAARAREILKEAHPELYFEAFEKQTKKGARRTVTSKYDYILKKATPMKGEHVPIPGVDEPYKERSHQVVAERGIIGRQYPKLKDRRRRNARKMNALNEVFQAVRRKKAAVAPPLYPTHTPGGPAPKKVKRKGPYEVYPSGENIGLKHPTGRERNIESRIDTESIMGKLRLEALRWGSSQKKKRGKKK